MIGESSSSSHSSFNGSNALSHIYIQYPLLRCHIPGSKSLFYDDGNKLILSLTSNQVFSWKIDPYNPYVAPSSDPITEGPVLSIRYSLDLRFLAIQRSRHEMQIWNKETGETSSQKCRSESESILGFFWTDCPTCDIVFVKTSALEFYSYNTESRLLHLVETKKINISWYIYTHESRLVLLASGMQCKSFSGYQLSSAGIIRLPRFEMVMTKTEENDRPILAAEDVHLITVYGRIYCLQFDRSAMILNLYRFYRDSSGSLPACSNRIAVSVVDNILLVHQMEANVVIIYDIYADSLAPISAPLPLFLRGYSKANAASSQTNGKTAGASESINLTDTEITIYGDQWNFIVPDLICDVSNGFLWKINVDLEAISASSSEVRVILEFLQRRKLEADKAKQLCLAIIRTIILERKPVAMVSSAIHVLLTAYGHAIKSGSYYKRIISPVVGSNLSTPSVVNESTTRIEDRRFNKQETENINDNEPCNRSTLSNADSDGSLKLRSHNLDPPTGEPHNDQLDSNASGRQQSEVTSSAATSPEDFQGSVFSIVEEEIAGDGSYLTAIVVEFLRSASSEKIKVHPNTYILMVQILARDEQYAELGLFIMNKIIEPSKEVALQLLESGRQNIEIRKLGLVNTVRPSLFLEAAYSSKDPQHVAAVLRFFCDFIPGFKTTSDHQTYYRLCAEMSS
ncbi:hypothetical protein OROGR_006733 [Orobanche gracilis]